MDAEKEIRQAFIDCMGIAMGGDSKNRWFTVGIYLVGEVRPTEDSSLESVVAEVGRTKERLADRLVAGLKKEREFGLSDEEIVESIWKRLVRQRLSEESKADA